jgi:hypothetical protein
MHTTVDTLLSRLFGNTNVQFLSVLFREITLREVA